MDEKEQITICREIAVACMWGQGGIASVILDRLEKALPQERRWQEVYSENAKQAKRDSVGVITDMGELRRRIRDGYSLCNHDSDGASLHYPSRSGGGLAKYVSKELAETMKAEAKATEEHMRNFYQNFSGLNSILNPSPPTP